MAVQPGLCQTWSETPKTSFLTMRLILFQIKKLLAKVVSRDTLNYRKLTDKPEQEEPGDADKPQPMEVDPDKIVSGMS